MFDDPKVCPFCAEDIKAAAIVCKHCGREISKFKDQSTQTEQIIQKNIPQFQKPKEKKSFSWLWILLLFYAIFKIYDASQKAEIKENLSSGRLFTDCYSCSDGVPLYNDIQLPQRVINHVPHGTLCSVDSWYPAGDYQKNLENEYGGRFASDSFYLVNCNGKEGWIYANQTTRTKP